jgi:DNA mismatch repair protein MutS
MYDEYGLHYKQYSEKYGPKTALFLMVGSFYELYDVQDKTTGETLYNIKEVTDFLGIQLTPKKDLPASYSLNGAKQGLFAGFPDYTLHKHAARLTSTGWTVVVIDQVKDTKSGKVLKRQVSRVLSPSTHIEAMSVTETPYMTVLFFYSNNSYSNNNSSLVWPRHPRSDHGTHNDVSGSGRRPQ